MSTIALGVTFAALCILFGGMTCWPVAYRRGLKHAAEEAEWQRTDAHWKGLREAADRPAPVRPPRETPPAQPEPPRDGPGKHRHPAGPRHAGPRDRNEPATTDLIVRPGLPVAGYLPAPGPWDGTITVPAPVQRPPWETPQPEPEPQTQVLEPTPADCLRPDTLTDTAWTRQMARQLAQEMDRDIKRMEQDMDAWLAAHIGATDSTLKEITR